MNIFTKFNRKSIDDRQIDTLIGISKGLLADGKVDQTEAEFLLNWLAQSRQASDIPIIRNLLEKAHSMLADENLDDEESLELMALLHKIAGEPSALGELAKSSNLPLCEPAPDVVFPDRVFLFTGTCAYGSRKSCHEATESLGENPAERVTKTVAYRARGIPIAIITEEHWLDSGEFGV